MSADSPVDQGPVADNGSFIVFPKAQAAQARAAQFPGPSAQPLGVLPLAERVYPPRAPGAPPAHLQDSTPLADPWAAYRRHGSSVAAWRAARTAAATAARTTARTTARTAAASRAARARRAGRRRKNVVLAGALGLFFGPIGMLYASVKAAVAAVLVGSVMFTLTLVAGLAVFDDDPAAFFGLLFLQALLVGPVCGSWAAIAAAWRNRGLTAAQARSAV